MTRTWIRVRAGAITLALACAAVAPSLNAQNPPPRDPLVWSVPKGAASISGTVIDDERRPMRRVSVLIEGDARVNRTALTDDQGRFAVSGLPSARYTIRATKGGYPTVHYGAKRPGRNGSGLFLKDGEKVDGIVLQMARGAVITGTLFDAKGRPLPGVSITAYVPTTSLSGDFDMQPVVRSGSAFPMTDDLGMYRFWGLPAGEYIIGTSPFFTSNTAARVPTDVEIREAFGLAQQRQRAISTDPKAATPQTSAPVSNFAPVFSGDVSDPRTAARIRVAAGEERAGVDLHLTMQLAATISGEIIGPDAKVPDLRLQLARRDGASGQTSTFVSLATDGRFSYASQSPGEYVVFARTAAAPVLVAQMPVTLNGRDVTGLRLQLQPPMSATGRVVFEGTALPPPAVSAITVAPSSVSNRDFAFSGVAEIKDTFDFTLPDLVPGRYRFGAVVRAAAAAPGAPVWTLARVMYGDRDVTDLPVQVEPGAAVPPITVTFTDSPSELSGNLLTATGQPASDYFVVVVPADEKYWISNTRRIKSTRPDAAGRYVFPGLPPGQYRIAATTDLDPSTDLANLTFLREISAAATDVKVGVGEKKSMDLKIGSLRQ